MSDSVSIAPRRALAYRGNSNLQLLNEFLKEGEQRGIGRSTIVRYSFICKEFFAHIGGLLPHEIRPRDIREYLAWKMNRGASNNSLHLILCGLRSLFRFAEAMEIVPVSPARSLQTRRYHRKLPRVLTEEQVHKMIESEKNLRDRALLETLYCTGCRASEVINIRLDDISWSARTILVTGKGNKQRLVPLSKRTVGILTKYLNGRSTGWLFQAEGHGDQRGGLSRNLRSESWIGTWRDRYAIESNGNLRWHTCQKRLGKISEMTQEEARAKLDIFLADKLAPRPRPVKIKQITPRAIHMIVRKAGLRAEVGHVHPHMLRHCFATHLLDGGADILTISRFLGHENLTTTAIYTHVSQTKMHDTLEKCHPHWREK